MKRNWNKFHATSLQAAIEGCVYCARDKHNLSIERIAELMGLPSHWVIYKWMQKGTIPADKIRPFEYVCRCEFITKYLGYSAHKLVIDIPTGRNVTAADISKLQIHTNDTVRQLLKFQANPSEEEAAEAVRLLEQTMEKLAWHKRNVERVSQPELDFGGEA